MKKIAKIILAILTRLTLKQFKPKIVGVTGSVGKTSTKDAVALVLSSKFKVRASWENYNNEIGLPLSVLGGSNPKKNIVAWIWLVIKSLVRLFGSYPEILVLEFGADRPGDIAYLNNLVKKLDAAAITDIGVSHMEFYPSQQALVKEKFAIAKIVVPSGVVALNLDSPKVFDNRHLVSKPISGFGFSQQAQIRATDFNLLESKEGWGVNFKIHHKGTVVPVFLPNTAGRPAVYAALAAAAVGLHFGLNLVDISQALKKYQSPRGRLRIIAGIKHTIIIDDTYNAAPSSTIAALDALKMVAAGRTLAALGSMAELGKAEEQGIAEVALKLLEAGVNGVFLVGQQADRMEKQLEAMKFSGKTWKFKTADEAGIPIQTELKPSDTILIKGSQASRMEKIVKEIMAEPLAAPKLLVRQSSEWLDKM